MKRIKHKYIFIILIGYANLIVPSIYVIISNYCLVCDDFDVEAVGARVFKLGWWPSWSVYVGIECIVDVYVVYNGYATNLYCTRMI